MEKLESRLSEISIADVSISPLEDTKWGWPLKDLYRLSLSFYKGTMNSISSSIVIFFFFVITFPVAIKKKPDKH